MVLNPYKVPFEARQHFDSIFSHMRKHGQEISKLDTLREIGLKFPISIESFKKYIDTYYVKAGLIVEQDDFYIVNPKLLQRSAREKEADSILEGVR